MNKTILINLSPQDLAELVGNTVQQQFEIFSKQQSDKSFKDELLTRKQACELLGIEQTTLYHWTNAGKIIAYGIGNRRYYKRSELMEALQKVKK